MKTIAFRTLFIVLTITLFGCTATIREPQNVSHHQASFKAQGASACGQGGVFRFEYSTSKAVVEAGYGTQSPSYPHGETTGACDAPRSEIPFAIPIGGLSANTTYHYRLCGRSDTMTSDLCTEITTFTTRPVPGPMLPITVAGENLLRGGQPFRVFGLQPLDHQMFIEFLAQGTTAQKQWVTDHITNGLTYGANTLRIHLDLWDFVSGTNVNNLHRKNTAFANLAFLINVAESEGMYLQLSGNNSWKIGPSNIPVWYDQLPHRERWKVQKYFFEELAKLGVNSPAVLGYELMNEPAISSDPNQPWYAGNIGDYYFVQYIARGITPGAAGRQEMRDWINLLSTAIRTFDSQALVTIGAIGAFPTAPSGISNTQDLLDYLSPHIYPNGTDLTTAVWRATQWAGSYRPVVLGETSLFKSTESIHRQFLAQAALLLNGIISFYPGYGPDDYDFDENDIANLPIAFQQLNLRVFQEYRDDILNP